jgi:hypothetical protein
MYICDMLRKAAVWILLFVMIFETSGKTMLLLSFEMNRDFIAKELCVKKDIPDNCCKGSCQLTREMKEQDDRESKSFPSLQVKSELLFFETKESKLHFYMASLFVPFHDFIVREDNGHTTELMKPPIA